MHIGAEIEWRKDGFGKEAHALFLGDLYVGHINGQSQFASYKPNQWRGWFMSDDDGNETGWFPTAEEARGSVEKALFTAIKF